MRVYEKEKIKEIYCNKCGKKIEMKNEVLQEDVLQVDKVWGYFSKKDGIKHSFDLCEDCYDRIIESFKYPITEAEETELL